MSSCQLFEEQRVRIFCSVTDADIEDNLDTDSGKRSVAPIDCDIDDKTSDVPTSAMLCGDIDNEPTPAGGEAVTLDVHKPGCHSDILHGGPVSCTQESDCGISSCGVHTEDAHLVELTDQMNAMDIAESARSDNVTKAETYRVLLGDGCAGSRDDVKVTSDAENLHKTGDDERKVFRTEVSLYVSEVKCDGNIKSELLQDVLCEKNEGKTDFEMQDISRVTYDGQNKSEVLRDDSRLTNGGHGESDVLDEVSIVKDDGQGNPEVKDLSRVRDEIKNNGQSDLDGHALSQVKDDAQSKTEVRDVTRLKDDGPSSIEAHDLKETNCSDRKSLVNNVETEIVSRGRTGSSEAATDGNSRTREKGNETELCTKLPHSQCNGRLSPCGSCDESRIVVGTPANASPADVGRTEGEKQTNSTLGLLRNTKYQKKLEVRLKVRLMWFGCNLVLVRRCL